LKLKSEKSGYVLQEYAQLATQYDKRWAFYIEATARETIKRLNLNPAEKLLDVGCGTGALLEAIHLKFPEVEVAGVDPSAEMLDVARRKLAGNITLEQGWAEALPFPDESFDVIVSCSAFHFCREPARALEEFRRVLKPGGRIVVTDWCDDYLTCRIHDFFLRLFNRAHFKTYGSKGCVSLLEKANFGNVNLERYKINWLWGMMTAQATIT